MQLSAAIVAFFALVCSATAVRDMKLASTDLVSGMQGSPLNTEGDETKATQLVNKLQEAILTRKGDLQVGSYLENLFSSRTARVCDATSPPRLTLYKAGWECALRPLGLSESDADALMAMLGTPDAAQQSRYITTSIVKDAILGQGAEEEREQVLEFVWKKVTRHDAGDGTLEAEDLVCKKPDTRETFINYIKWQAGVSEASPLTYDAFRKYYLDLGSSITSHRLFVLILVNAWHIMDPPYDQVNTVNIRVRAVKAGEDSDAGRIYALKDDCGAKDGEDGLDKLARIKRRLEQQTGETFKFVSLSDSV